MILGCLLLALITAGLLQILSNLANDYGDAVKGAINRIASGRCADAERVITPSR